MSYFRSLKRKAHPVVIDDVTHYVRALTPKELQSLPACDENMPDEVKTDKGFQLLRMALVDADGNLVLTADDTPDVLLETTPEVVRLLMDKVVELITGEAQKKTS